MVGDWSGNVHTAARLNHRIKGFVSISPATSRSSVENGSLVDRLILCVGRYASRVLFMAGIASIISFRYRSFRTRDGQGELDMATRQWEQW
uniref:Uncharacterized protein n=1 Tax=Picea glauca TaxID=3330 RepID=A0A101LV67_PICGL|nr:hypothetical protein ABT39_MTgene2044 [Picea glauca]